MTKFVPKEVLGDSTFVSVYDPESGDTGYVRMGDLVSKSESTVTATTGPGGGIELQVSARYLQASELIYAVPGVDTTGVIQAALDRSAGIGEVVLSGEHTINATGITVPSNSVLRFAPGAKLSLSAHNTTTYQILRLHDVENVEIRGAVVDGRKDLNAASTGEWGMGISIRGSKNVMIDSPVTDNCWGDGIYIGSSVGYGTTGGLYNCSEDIEVSGHKSRGNRRQGMSIVSARRCRILNAVLAETAGTAPKAGLDIEPNYPTEVLEGIVIDNPTTYSNAGAGILIDLNKLTGTDNKVVSISITGHKDTGSLVGFWVIGKTIGIGVHGVVESINPIYSEAKESAVRVRGWNAGGPILRIDRPIALNCNNLNSANQKYASTFAFYREPSDVAGYSIGGFEILNPTIENISTTAPRPFYIKDEIALPLPVNDVKIIDPLRLVGITVPMATLNFFGAISDRYKKWARTISVSTTITDDYSTPTVLHNRTSESLITLSTGEAGGHPIAVENVNTGQVKVLPPAGGRFLGQAVGAYYQSAASAGHLMRLTPLGAGVWRIDDMIGSWTLIAA